MRLLFVVQRYGPQIAGGAETFCREFATRLKSQGVDVEVVTSRAKSYVDWANELPEGTEVDSGVPVHRLSVAHEREDRLFGPMNARVMLGRRPLPDHLQRAWMRMQGPYLEELPDWLAERAASYDAVVFFTYLYYTTWAGLPIASSATTAVLHPTAHDEPPMSLPLFDLMFRLPHGFGFLTEEEAQLVDRRFGIERPFSITGIGIELDQAGDGDRFRAAFGVGDVPYIIYVGRLDPHKGSLELYDYFATFKKRNPGPLKLVVVGEPVRPLPPHDDIITTGFVSNQDKHDAIAGSELLVHPSYFESFSIVLTEAWLHRRPALVQGHSAVLAGQARRSGGGIPYQGYAEFEAALQLLLGDATLRAQLGAAGRDFVERRYDWPSVLAKYGRFLDSVIDQYPTRRMDRHRRLATGT
jgi:glycosyltransferase involved in cell wall biosynthesis